MPEEPAATRVDQALHILHACNANSGFVQWMSVPGKEMDKLVINVNEDAKISIDTLCALLRAFPVRMRGPLLAKKTLIFEFLHEHQADAAAITVASQVSKKRKLQTLTSGDETSESALYAKTLNECLHEYNSSSVCIAAHRSGLDDRGRWHVFDVSFPERFNLMSVVAFYTHKNSASVKDITLVLGESPHVFVRPFLASERRIVHEWELVPKYTPSGTFTHFRHRASRQ